jgi:outer membrane protein TolC
MKQVMVLLILFSGSIFAQEVLSLDDCVNIALENNSTLKQAKYSNESADYDEFGSYAGILPQVNLSFRKGETNVGRSQRIIGDAVIGLDPQGNPIYGTARITTPKQYYKDHSFSVGVNQNIYDGGRWWNTIYQAETNKEGSDFSFDNEINYTILTTQFLYYDLLKQSKIYEVNKIAVQRSQDQVNLTQKMFDLGSAAKLDVYLAKVNLGNDRISLLTQENIVSDARRNLNIALGRNPENPIEIKLAGEIPGPITPLNDMVQQALENQPLINKGDKDIESSEYGTSIAQANYWPTLSAYFQYNRRNSELEKIYSDLNLEYVWSVGVSLNWNLFNGFSDYVNVQKSKIYEKSVRETQALYIRQLKSNIEARFANYNSYIEIIEINKENLEAAKEELRLAEERYKIGAGTALDVREAQVKLTQAEQMLIAAEYNALSTLAELDYELGLSQNKILE